MTPGSPAARASRASTARARRCSRPRASASRSIRWSAGAPRDILAYIKQAGLPPHPLVAKGFPSIGCLPCTSLVRPGRGRARRPLARPRQDRMRHSSGRARRGSEHLMALWRDGAFAEDSLDVARRRRAGAGRRARSWFRWRAGGARARRLRRARPVGVEIAAGKDALRASGRRRRPSAGRAEVRQIRATGARSPTRSCCASATVSRANCARSATCCSTRFR